MNKNRKEIREKTSKPLLWIGMASIGMAFAGLTSGYVVSKSSLVSRGAWQTIALPNEFLLSTLFIILSSLLLVFASKKIRIGHYKYSTILLGLALLFGTLFLLCQVLGWNNLIENQGSDGEVSVPCKLADNNVFAVTAVLSNKTSVRFVPFDLTVVMSALRGIT